jgi:hypothetical protein
MIKKLSRAKLIDKLAATFEVVLIRSLSVAGWMDG